MFTRQILTEAEMLRYLTEHRPYSNRGHIELIYIPSPYMTQTTVRERTWIERWLSPFSPVDQHYLDTEPKDEFLVFGNIVVAHPEKIDSLKRNLADKSKVYTEKERLRDGSQ